MSRIIPIAGVPPTVSLYVSEEKIQAFLPWIDSVVHEGLVTLETVRVLRYVAGGAV